MQSTFQPIQLVLSMPTNFGILLTNLGSTQPEGTDAAYRLCTSTHTVPTPKDLSGLEANTAAEILLVNLLLRHVVDVALAATDYGITTVRALTEFYNWNVPILSCVVSDKSPEAAVAGLKALSVKQMTAMLRMIKEPGALCVVGLYSPFLATPEGVTAILSNPSNDLVTKYTTAKAAL